MDGTNSMGERWRLAGVLLFGLTAGMGCMSFNLGNTYERASPTCYVDPSGLLRQNDTTPLAKTQDDRITIYYPRPYASKPHLKFVKTSDSINPNEIVLVEQLPDRFTIVWNGHSKEPVLAWQAEGLPSNTLTPPLPEGKTESKAIIPVNGER